MESARVLDMKFIHTPSPSRWQIAYLLIDGRTILGGPIDGNTIRRVVSLSLGKGVHTYEIYVRDQHAGSKVIVGIGQDDGTYAPIEADLFDPEKIPELAEHLEPIADITRSETGFAATFKGERRLRTLRWVFEDFSKNAVQAKALSVIDDSGNQVIPVKVDFSAATANDILEISPGDKINVLYKDLYTRRGQEILHTARLNAAYADGKIAVSEEVLRDLGGGRVESTYLDSLRYRLGDQFTITVRDYDLDITPQADKVPVTVTTAAGESLTLQAMENHGHDSEGKAIHSGVFHAILKTGARTEPAKHIIKVGPGEVITVSYLDEENSNPGIPFERTYSVIEAGKGMPELEIYETSTTVVEDHSRAAREELERMKRKGKDTDGLVILRNEIVARHPDYLDPSLTSTGTPSRAEHPADEDTRVSIGAPLLFEVIHPSRALHKGSTIKALAVTGRERAAALAEKRDPNWLELELPLGTLGRSEDGTAVRLITNNRRSRDAVLQDGVFVGSIRLQVGAPGDPVDDSVGTTAPDHGIAVQSNGRRERAQARPALLVTGPDSITIRVKEETPGKGVEQTVQLVSEGRLDIMDQTYSAAVEAIHMGQTFHLRLNDPDQDTSDELDTIEITCHATGTMDKTVMVLTETLPHSGVFTGKLTPTFLPSAPPVATTTEAVAPPAPDPTDEILHVKFGERVSFAYADPMTLTPGVTNLVEVSARIHFGDNGNLSSFSKHFSDPEMAVKVRFLWAEALFEMAKSLRKLKKNDQARERIAEGERILYEALRDYPNTKLKAQGAFLLANLSQELARDEEDEALKLALYEKAMVKYASIASTWPESDQAPRSLYKKALCLELIGDMDRACEEYVRLTYTYPEHRLVSDAVLRLGSHYLRTHAYGVSARIFSNFAERNPTHSMAPRSLFLSAQAHIRGAQAQSESTKGRPNAAAVARHYASAIDALELLIDEYREDKTLRAEAMYWLGDCAFKSRDHRKAYIGFKTLTFEYPESVWAKRARGYLTDTAFSRVEE